MPEQMLDTNRLQHGFRIGDFHADPQRQRLYSGEEEIRVEPKVMEVLLFLAAHQGQTIPKDHFLDAVWGETVVTEDALLRCISELRKIFDDDPRAPRYIETIRKRGYRLVAPVVLAGPGAGAGEEAGDGDGPEAALPEGPTPATPVVARPAPPPPPSTPAPRRKSTVPLAGALLLLAVAAAALYLLAGGQKTETADRLLPLRTVPITSYPGIESDPNLSPDGTRVAFVWDGGHGDTFDIYVKQIGVETPLQLTESPEDDASPSWSPDGQQLAFVRRTPGANGVYVVPAVGGTEQRIADLGGREVRSVAWSPDGTTLAVAAQSAPHAPFAVSVIDLQTRSERPITVPPADHRGDVEIAFSPDGRLLAVIRSVVEKVDDLYIVPLSGGEMKRLTFDHAEITGIDWSADGSHLIYSSDRDGSPALWRLPLAGGTASWIPTVVEGSGAHQPSVARRGGRLVYMQRLQETNIWAYSAAASGMAEPSTAPLIASTRWDSNPAISPDGRRVAFASTRSGAYEIWLTQRDGSRPLRLTRFEGPFTVTPRWSPDGRELAFVARDGGSVDVYVVGTDGGAPRRLTSAASNDQAPSWSADGRWIYFSSNRTGDWEIWKIPAEDGTPVQVTTGGGYAAQEGPGGRELYYTRRDAPGIWKMPASGGPAVRINDTLEPFDWGNWQITEAGLFYMRRSGGTTALLHQPAAGGPERTLVELTGVPRHPSLAVSQDGREILLTRIDRIEGDLMLAAEGYDAGR